MNIEQLFSDKTITAKSKVATISGWLLNRELSVEQLLAFADKQKPTDKATCIEAIESATKKTTAIATTSLLTYVTAALKDEVPRVKWESARVVANIIKAFPEQIGSILPNLLANSKHEGTVVRWATATALGEIIKIKSEHNKQLVPNIEAIVAKEEDSGIQKKYCEALKKIKK